VRKVGEDVDGEKRFKASRYFYQLATASVELNRDLEAAERVSGYRGYYLSHRCE
jgi:hypothetical protein